MNILGEARILKDDRGVYKTTLVNTESNKETGEEEKIFMKINVGFRKGVELKNKTKINIKDGFLTFFRMATGNTYEDGKLEYKKFPKIMIMDFEVLEEGTDEPCHSKDYSDTQSNSNEDTTSEFYPSEDELPF